MAEATLVFRVPAELQDTIINVVSEILSIKELFHTGNSSPTSPSTADSEKESLPTSKEDSITSNASGASIYRENNKNIYTNAAAATGNAIGNATGNATSYAACEEEKRVEVKEEEKEIVKEKDEEKREEKKEELFTPPSFDEVSRYIAARKSRVNAGRFYSWLDRNNWIDGRGEPVTDWKKKLEEWEERESQFSHRTTRVQRMNSQLIQHTDTVKPETDDTEKLLKMLGLAK